LRDHGHEYEGSTLAANGFFRNVRRRNPFDERDSDSAVYVRYPKLLIEVLSKSTASLDRTAKLHEYRSIETLEEYVLVDSRKRWAQTNVRVPSGERIASLPIESGSITLTSIGLTIDLDDLYAECVL